MKKSAKLVLLTLAASAFGLAACGEEAAPFKVGTDVATYEVEGHSDWAGTVTANVLIQAGDDVIYSGTVKVTSDSLYASEFFKGACLEKQVNIEGVENGFVTSIGSYANITGTNSGTYWMWQYNDNNPTNFSCNDVHVFEGDYLQYNFQETTW